MVVNYHLVYHVDSDRLTTRFRIKLAMMVLYLDQDFVIHFTSSMSPAAERTYLRWKSVMYNQDEYKPSDTQMTIWTPLDSPKLSKTNYDDIK